MFTRSIRWRLVLWLAFLLVGILAGFGITAYQLHRANRFSQIDEELVRRVAALSRDTRPGPGFPPDRGRFGPGEFHDRGREPRSPKRGGDKPGLQDASTTTNRGRFGPASRGPGRGENPDAFFGMMARDDFGPPFIPPWFPDGGPEFRTIQLSVSTTGLFDDTSPNGFYYAIWSRGGRELKRSTNAPAGTPFPNPSKTDTRIRTRGRADYREAYQSTDFGECVLAGRSITSDLAAIRRFGWLLALTGMGVLFLGLGGGWWLASGAIRPIEDISATAGRIAAGNLAERINVAETDSELGRLAAVLNSAFANLEAAFAQQRQFTADAAHELRTPIAVLISEAQTTLRRARSTEEYREALEMCLETAQQMRRLTQSLLELARLDASQGHLQAGEFDLADLAGACADFIQSLGQQRSIRITCNLSPSSVRGDSDRLSQVLTNLLNNAIQYGKEGGEVRVSTHVESGIAVLTVADDGPGISAEDLPHVFERFYRGDKARARKNGHAGLGLAICKAIVEAHGGTIEATSKPGLGTKVTVRLPACVGQPNAIASSPPCQESSASGNG